MAKGHFHQRDENPCHKVAPQQSQAHCSEVPEGPPTRRPVWIHPKIFQYCVKPPRYPHSVDTVIKIVLGVIIGCKIMHISSPQPHQPVN